MGPNPGEITILLACLRTMASELYQEAFNRCSGFRVVARAASISEALEAVRSHDVQVALISSTLKDGPLSGILALQQIQEVSPSVKSVVLLEPNENHLVTAAFRAGAKGVFSPADEGRKSLCRCVRQVSAGQIWANSAQLQEVFEAFSRHAPIKLVNADGARLLTKREEDVVRLVTDGYTNRQIAKELQLSEHTIRNNLFRIFDKLGVSTRVELALYAVNHSKHVPLQESLARKDVVAVGPSEGRSAAAS